MRIGLDTLTKFLNLGSRKHLSSPRNAYLPNIFAHRNPRMAARSAKLRAARSAGQIHSTAARGSNPRTARHRHKKKTHPAKPLRRCNTAVVPPPATYPYPPGAYILEPSFVVPGFPDVDHRHIPPLVAQKLFMDALFAGRQTLLRAAEERDAEAEEARQCAAEEAEAEFARLMELDSRKADEAHRKAVEEEYVRLLEEDRRKAEEEHRRAVEEEERRRAEQERAEARERERRERSHRQDSTITGARPRLEDLLLDYEAKWAVLRGNDAPEELFQFCDFPWPVFQNVQTVGDVTQERVWAFVSHPLHEQVQRHGEGKGKTVRSEMLRRWHPDKFEGRVLHKVVEHDREAVRATAGHVARFLTSFYCSAEML
jgi:hypothetical protein